MHEHSFFSASFIFCPFFEGWISFCHVKKTGYTKFVLLKKAKTLKKKWEKVTKRQVSYEFVLDYTETDTLLRCPHPLCDLTSAGFG